MHFDPGAGTLSLVNDGRLKALAITGTKRSATLPNVPTVFESGVGGYEVYEWNALFAPTGTPDVVVEKISAAFKKTLEAPEVKARIVQLGGELRANTPSEAQKFIADQTQLWAKVVKARNIKVE